MRKEVKQQQLTEKKQQRKGLGNRRLQRFRRKCRVKGMNNQTIEMLMNIHKATKSSHPDNQQIHEDEEKEMVTSSKMNTARDSDMSMLFEDQDHSNECRSKEENRIVNLTSQSPILLPSTTRGEWVPPPSTSKHQKRLRRYNLSSDHWQQSSKLIPNYNQLSPYQFKDLFVKVIPLADYQKIEPWLTNFTMLEFIQQRTAFMCTVFQLKIEQNYWNYIANLSTMPVMNWLSAISKDVTQQNSINWDHTKTKINIEYRQQILKTKLKQAENNLNIHLQQPYPFSWQMETKTSLDHSINIISKALLAFVQNSLYYFRTNFEQKKILLKFDINDVHLVKSFYDLKPTEEQICIIQKIWRTKVKSCKKTLRRKKKNHPSIMSRNTAESINQHQQQNDLLSTDSFDESMRTIVEARLANIQQRIQRLMSFINTLSDNKFF